MKLVIIDSYSLIYKCFYGVRPMHSSKGVQTNAIYGFLNIILKIINDYNPDYLFAAFDEGRHTFRHDKFSEYKAGRQSMPEDLREQIPYIENLLSSANIEKLSKEGYEADDIIGSVSEIADKKGIDTLVLTGDRDSFQLVSDHTNILYSKRGIGDTVLIDEKYIDDTYGVSPKQMIDIKGLMGDNSDNIPGVKGVGEKTALKLIKEYGNIENLYEHIDEQKGKLKEKLVDGREDAFLSKDIGTIETNMDIDIDFNNEREYDFKNPEFVRILKELDFEQIIKRLGVENVDVGEIISEEGHQKKLDEIKDDYIVINSKDEISLINKNNRLYVYFENNDGYVRSAIIYDENKFYYVSELSLMADILKGSKFVTCDYKDNYKYFLKQGFDIKCDFDIFLAGYLLNPSDERYSIEVLSKKYLDIIIQNGEKKDIQRSIFDLNKEQDLTSLIKRGKIVYLLYDIMVDLLKEDEMYELYKDIEHKLMFVLGRMELIGFSADKKMLETLGSDFDKQISEIEKKIFDLAEEEFNINSPKQLGVILFEKLGLPVIKKTKSGYSTNIEVLEKLKDKHPIIELIIKLRSVTKLNSTYVKGLIPLIDEKGKIHSTFNQTITTTGRISSSNPNLQNIPIRTNEGRVIRKVFIPSSEDNVLVSADYSQIELRVLADISGDEKLINSFKNNEDIHSRTASEVFNVPIDDVPKEYRSRAKAVNFGIVYGISDFGLSKDLDIPKAQAKEYITTYLDKYPNVKKYMNDIVEYAKENGFVKTMFNRRRYIKEIYSKNFNVRSFAERTALNTPIQGSAADIIKIAMIAVDEELNKRNMKAKLILQIHDELIVDSPLEEKDEVISILKEKMESAAKLKCPIKADISYGKSWYEAK